jgi:hypothetical protein
MLTAVTPDLDTVDMPFDDSRCKLVDRAEIIAAVEKHLRALADD